MHLRVATPVHFKGLRMTYDVLEDPPHTPTLPVLAGASTTAIEREGGTKHHHQRSEIFLQFFPPEAEIFFHLFPPDAKFFLAPLLVIYW